MSKEQGHLINAGNCAGNITSVGMMLDNVNSISIQHVFTGSPVGTIKLQAANDLTDTASEVVNWQDYDAVSQAITTSGNVLWELTPITVKWIRVVYTFSSGTGALTSVFYSVTFKGE